MTPFHLPIIAPFFSLLYQWNSLTCLNWEFPIFFLLFFFAPPPPKAWAPPTATLPKGSHLWSFPDQRPPLSTSSSWFLAPPGHTLCLGPTLALFFSDCWFPMFTLLISPTSTCWKGLGHAHFSLSFFFFSFLSIFTAYLTSSSLMDWHTTYTLMVLSLQIISLNLSAD